MHPSIDVHSSRPETIGMGVGARIAIVAGDPLARAGLSALAGASSVALDEGSVAPAIARGDVDCVVWDLGQDPVAARAAVARVAALAVPVIVLVPEGLPPRAALAGRV